ncbi:MAG: nicotinic acid mononucleotide adenylyltransferase, partial [Gemmatimonadota bacterium]
LLGADAARGFAGWREPERIRSLARIAVYARGAEPVPDGFDFVVAGPRLELSSSEVRARVAAGRSLVGWVPERVGDYISGLQLYRSEAG